MRAMLDRLLHHGHVLKEFGTESDVTPAISLLNSRWLTPIMVGLWKSICFDPNRTDKAVQATGQTDPHLTPLSFRRR